MRNQSVKRTIGKTRPSTLAGVLAFALLVPGTADAHFLWLTCEREAGKPVVQAFLSETPTAEGPEFLKSIERARITACEKALDWTKGEDTYRVNLPEPCPEAIDGFCDLGMMKRNGTTFRLIYTARVQLRTAPDGTAEAPDHLRLRLVARPGPVPIVVVSFRGKPAPGAVVKAFPEEGESVELKADAQGRVEYRPATEGRAGLLAKWSEKTSGTLDGQSYDEVRYYATLTVAPADTVKGSAVTVAPSRFPFATLPEAINSFGGAVLGDWLYVYSGHIGATHGYHGGTATKHFYRLSLKDRTTWEELPCGPALQGVTLVAHRDHLYRIGGMAAHNRPGEPDDLVSVADFARFDPKSKTWTDLPPLPSPRSTHDAVVVGDKIYVVGGWSMHGGDSSNAEFLDTALVCDLSQAEPRWEELPAPPFRRRALAAASIQRKIYVLGGLTEDGKVVNSVAIYDPALRTWSHGPDLPGSRLEGFAPSAFGVDEKLYVSGVDGGLLRLNGAGNGWEVIGKLAIPRLTHRLLPGIANDVLAVGGNFAGAPVRFIESIPLSGTNPGPSVVAWSVPVASEAQQSQAVGLWHASIVAIGGNRSAEPHAFSVANLVRGGTRISVGGMTAEPLPELPEPRQSASFLVDGIGSRQTVYLIGGIGPDGDLTRTLGDVFRLDTQSRQWTKLPGIIPDSRGMFGAAIHQKAIWLFGGSVWNPRKDPDETTMVTDVLRWDPSRQGSSFETTGQKLPRARRSFAATVLDSKYYLLGGVGADGKPVETVDVFDFDGGAWTTIPAPTHPRLFADLAALEGKLYLFGGFIPSKEHHFEPAKSIEVYDPKTSRWTTLLDALPVPARHAHMLPIQNRLLIFAIDPKKDQAEIAVVAP
jgi:N-acetylneuraminic acid mutarotase